MQKSLEFLKKIEAIVENNKERLEEDALDAKRELSLTDSGSLAKNWEELQEEGREVVVGIVGGVKAGKSSLLNALFFDGQPILPKAATPMTAALTVLHYGTERAIRVEHYTAEDIKILKEESEAYTAMYEKKWELLEEQYRKEYSNSIESKFTPKELQAKAEKEAKKVLHEGYPSLCASHEQYQKITKSKYFGKEHTLEKTIITKDNKELQEILLKYVGADGEYMPFTKALEIALPIDALKNLRVVDTPGLNDPVRSREERTKQLLKKCDVALLISRTMSFLSKADVELFYNMFSREAIKEILILASQVDSAMLGDEIPKQSIKQAMDYVCNSLYKQVGKIEIDDNELRKKIQNKNNIIPVSARAYEIIVGIENGNVFEEDVEHTWGCLQTDFEQQLSGKSKEYQKEVLFELANMENIRNVFKRIEEEKERIIKEKSNSFIERIQISVKKYQSKLNESIKEQLQRIKGTEIETATQNIKELERVREELKSSLGIIYQYASEDFIRSITDVLQEAKSKYYVEEKLMENTIKSKEKNEKVNKEGFWNYLVRALSDGGTKTEIIKYKELNTATIYRGILGIEDKICNKIKGKINNSFRDHKDRIFEDIQKEMEEALQPKGFYSIQEIKSIKNIIFKLPLPEIDLEISDPSELNRGIIRDDAIENYFCEVEKYIRNMVKVMDKKITRAIKDIEEKLLKTDLAKNIINAIEKYLCMLQEDVKYKEDVLKELSSLQKAIEAIKI